MSIQYKTYPIKIDGGSVLDDVIGIFSKPAAVDSYEKAVTSVLDKLTTRSFGVGRILFNFLSKDKTIIIVPYKEAKCNAFARDSIPVLDSGDAIVTFSPATFNTKGGICSETYKDGIGMEEDEALLHELLHAFRIIRGTFNQVALYKQDKMYGNSEELFAILITNMYMSENGKTVLRKDHTGFSALPQKWSTTETFMQDRDFFYWVERFWSEERQLAGMLSNLPAPFNPFRFYKEWLTNKVGIQKMRQY